MGKAVCLCIIDSKTWVAESAHDLTWIGPDGVIELMHIALMIVAAEDRVECRPLGNTLGNVWVMVDGNASAIELKFGELAMQGHVLKARCYLAEQEGIAIIVTKNRVNRLRESLGQLRQGKRRAEISEEQQGVALLQEIICQCSLEVLQAIVDVT